jgi:hypothetical protein
MKYRYDVMPKHQLNTDVPETFGTREYAIAEATKRAKTTFREHVVHDRGSVPSREIGTAAAMTGKWEWAKS